MNEYIEKKVDQVAINADPKPDNILDNEVGYEFAIIHGASDPKQIQGNAIRMELKKVMTMMEAFQISPAKSQAGKCKRPEDVDYNKHIVFTEGNLIRVGTPHHNELVITLRIVNQNLDKLLVDQDNHAIEESCSASEGRKYF